jgi:hypothetical protein
MQRGRTCPLPEPLCELGVFFPLTPTLSLRERGSLCQSVGESEAIGICESRALVLPLLRGEGWGEGELGNPHLLALRDNHGSVRNVELIYGRNLQA